MGTSHETRGRKRFFRRERESGAALVEMAIVAPLLAILLFGVVEYGTMISKNLALSSSTRAGARVGAQEGNLAQADYDILQAVENSRGYMDINSINKVVIYKSASAEGEVPEQCKMGIPVANVCNVYSSSAFDLTEDQLAASTMSANWAPTSRVLGTDYIGVWVIAEHDWLTGLFSSRPTQVADSAVMRIEPATTAPWTPPGGVAGTTTTSAIPTTTTAKPTTSTTKKPTTTKKPGATTTTKKPTSTTKKPTTTTKKPASTSTTKKSTTTTKKPSSSTSTTKKPTTTTKKPTTTTSTTQAGGGGGHF